MKYLIAFFGICYCTASASATAWDSLSKFKLPKHIDVLVNERLANFEQIWDGSKFLYQSSDTTPGFIRCSFSLEDTTVTSTLSHDTVIVTCNVVSIDSNGHTPDYQFQCSVATSETMRIEFDTTHKTVPQISYSKYTTYLAPFGGGTGGVGGEGWSGFTLQDIKFDSTRLFTDDRRLSNHLTMMYDTAIWGRHSEFGTGYHFVLAVSADINGTTLEDVGSVADRRTTTNISVRAQGGLITCSFPARAESCSLEVYSSLGVRAKSISIVPGQTSSALPRLVTGIYFIRLDGVVTKVYLPPG